MKVLIVVQNYYPSVGGTQILFQNIAERFVRDFKYEVEVFTTNSYYSPHNRAFKRISKKKENFNGVMVNRFPFIRFHLPLLRLLTRVSKRLFQRDIFRIEKYRTAPVSKLLKEAINKTNADVIIASSSAYRYMAYPLWRDKTSNPKPFIFHGAIHFNANEEEQFLTNSLVASIEASDCYVSNSAYETERLKSFGVSLQKIVTIGAGIDVGNFKNNSASFKQQYSINSDNISITYIGRLEKTKSIHVLIEAAKLVALQQNKITLIVAGTTGSNYVKKLISRVDASIKKHILLLTDLTEKDKQSLLHATDILVLPSVNESFGIVFLEAWACKKPVIGANIGAVSSVITDGVDGLLAKPLDANDLAEKILVLAKDESLRKGMGEKGYNKVLANYTWDKILHQYKNACLKAITNFNAKKKLL